VRAVGAPDAVRPVCVRLCLGDDVAATHAKPEFQ
jgi:hypothetical protein